MEIEIRKLDADSRESFYSVHSGEGCGWCFCVAWWVPVWEGWGDRTSEENRSLREELFNRGEFDGYLAYADGVPVGWCQTGRRDRLRKLVNRYGLTESPDAWAITCFHVVLGFRRRGVATRLLEGVIADLRAQGIRRVEAFPKHGRQQDAEDLWTGPEQIFLRMGFSAATSGSVDFPVLVLDPCGMTPITR